MRIKDEFSHMIQDYDSLQIFKEHKFHLFPMGKRMTSALKREHRMR